MNLGLYIHIPFCKQKCLYCDFPSYPHMEGLYESYTDALCREITGQGVLFSTNQVDTIYIGGGTPTALPAPLLLRIVAAVMENFAVTTDAEISIEANPGTVDGDTLTALRAVGINRISFGVQTFSDTLLKGLGRIHTGEEGANAVRIAKRAGFSNINIDLMYGLPLQQIEHFQQSLQIAYDLAIPHISVYGLKIEDETPFACSLAQGKLSLPSEEEEEAMYDRGVTYLPQHGYERYEISNYSRPGFSCRHNLKYWNYAPYLGLGAAAHSFINRERLANTQDVRTYLECINSGCSPVEHRETADEATQMAEFCFLALRTNSGISYHAFYQYFGKDFYQNYEQQITSLTTRGLVTTTQQSIRLTNLGMKYGNIVFRTFLP